MPDGGIHRVVDPLAEGVGLQVAAERILNGGTPDLLAEAELGELSRQLETLRAAEEVLIHDLHPRTEAVERRPTELGAEVTHEVLEQRHLQHDRGIRVELGAVGNGSDVHIPVRAGLIEVALPLDERLLTIEISRTDANELSHDALRDLLLAVGHRCHVHNDVAHARARTG